MIIDSTYFIREITIPNLDKAGNSSTLDTDIVFYEKEILMDALGYQLYSEFITAIEGTPAQKWIDLRDGAEFSFEYSGVTITRKWAGLKNSDKISLLAYYTYAMYLRKMHQQLTSIGTVVSQSENSMVVNGSDKFINAWNRFIEQYGEVPDGFDPYNESHYIHFDDKPTLYNFLLAGDYDNWIYTRREGLNAFGF